MILPTTVPGRRAAFAGVAWAAFMGIFALLVASGQRGGEGFFDNLWLTVPFLAAYVAAVASFVLGTVAIATAHERSIVVVAVTVVALLVTTFGVLEVAFPH